MNNVVYTYELSPDGSEWRVKGVIIRGESINRFMLPFPSKWGEPTNIVEHDARQAVLKFFEGEEINPVKI